MGLVVSMVEILVAGLTAMASGLGSGLASLVQQLFVTVTPGTNGAPDTYTLTTFGVTILAFAGISLAVGLSTKIVMWLTSLGSN